MKNILISAAVVSLLAATPILASSRYDDLKSQVAGIKLPARDAEDRSPLSTEERKIVRFLFPGWPTAGPYQYPRWAPKLMRFLKGYGAPATQSVPDTSVGTNIDISNQPGPQSECTVAMDFLSPNYIAAASNQISVNPQGQYSSTDSGATWTFRNMPLGGANFQSDPGVAFDSIGNLYTVSLGILASTTRVQISKSTDHGNSWGTPVTVDTNANNDKELMACDYQAASPCLNDLYIAWDRAGVDGRFSRSTNGGTSWSASTAIAAVGSLIGACPAVGPSGEVYVAYADYNAQNLKIYKSTNCGVSFSAAHTIASTTGSFQIDFPADCSRGVLIYPSIDVDRSGGPRNGWVYASWTDGVDGGNCPANSGTADVWFSRSTDGGTTWSAKSLVHESLPSSEQFFQWLACDPANGDLHVSYDDTRDDATRKKTNVYINRSTDGGSTWSASVKVTTAQTDETCCGAETGNQYGDYAGLVAYNGLSYPVWTDRRSGADEEIYTAQVNDQGGCNAPAANFSGNPTSGNAPLTVSFTDQSINAPTSWSWTFGDGGTSTAQNPSHTYNTPGTYTVALTATNGCGSNTLSKPNYITVTSCSVPVADFSGNPTSGTPPLAVSFTDLSTNAPTSWSWTFGDGGTSTAKNPSHTYGAVGTYTVSLTATNACGSNTASKPNYITVSSCPAPAADFSGNPLSGAAPLAVNFSDLSSNTPSAWSWTFGDGGTSTARNPSHTYAAAGSYTVSLTASNACGSNTNTKPSYVTVTGGSTVKDEIVTGASYGSANAAQVKIWDHSVPPNVVHTFTSYGAGYGVNVAAGAITSSADVLTGPGPGAVYGPQVRAFFNDGSPIAKVNFYAYGTLRYGVNVSAGDVDGDGYAEILTGAGPGSVFGPHVRGFNFDATTVTSMSKLSFFAYATLKYGVNVAGGNLDGDVYSELATAPGPGGVFGPQVRGFNFDGGPLAAIAKVNYNAFATGGYGARIALCDVDADGYAELLAGKGPAPSLDEAINVHNYDNGSVALLFTINAYASLFYGAHVGGGDVDGDGRAELFATPGPGPANPASVTGYHWDGSTAAVTVPAFTAYGYVYGTNAACGDMGSI